TTASRASAFDRIPTMAEAGLQGLDVTPWCGLMAPNGTPAERIARINRDVNAALRDPQLIKRFTAQGAEPYATSPEEFAALLRADVAKWGEVVRASGASVD